MYFSLMCISFKERSLLNCLTDERTVSVNLASKSVSKKEWYIGHLLTTDQILGKKNVRIDHTNKGMNIISVFKMNLSLFVTIVFTE